MFKGNIKMEYFTKPSGLLKAMKSEIKAAYKLFKVGFNL